MREALYFFGDPGAGKTKAALSIADVLRDHNFHYIEADRPVDKIIASYDNLENIRVWRAFTHDEIQSTIDRLSIILKASNPAKTWVIMDTVSKMYADAQDTFSLKLHGMTADDLKEKRLKEQEKGLVDNYRQGEWAVISRIVYNDVLFPIIRFYGNNYVLISHQRPYNVVRGTQVFHPSMPADSSAATRFQELGWLPQGPPKVPDMVDTCLHFNNTTNPFTIYTVKDTERLYLNKPMPFTHFWRDYNLLTANGHS